MRCFSKENLFARRSFARGFSLPEVVASLVILTLICTAVFAIIDRSVKAAADMEIRMQAFEIAQQNMEKILCARPVTELVDYGISEIYPAIQWKTVTEIVNDPAGKRMWVKATCSAEYNDDDDVLQTVEFTQWVSQLTVSQISQYLSLQSGAERQLADQLILDVKDAAEYAAVDIDAVKQWETGGMEKYKNQYVKMYLDLYKNSAGQPSKELKDQTIEAFKNLERQVAEESAVKDETPLPTDEQNPVNPEDPAKTLDDPAKTLNNPNGKPKELP